MFFSILRLTTYWNNVFTHSESSIKNASVEDRQEKNSSDNFCVPFHSFFLLSVHLETHLMRNTRLKFPSRNDEKAVPVLKRCWKIVYCKPTDSLHTWTQHLCCVSFYAAICLWDLCACPTPNMYIIQYLFNDIHPIKTNLYKCMVHMHLLYAKPDIGKYLILILFKFFF